MSDFGMFESDEAAQDQPRLAARTAARQLEAAIDTVRRDFGRFLLGATGIDEFGDRWHYSKHDIRDAVEPHIFPNTGTMRRIQNAMKSDWKLAHPYKLALSHDDAGFGSMPSGDGPPKNQDLDETYHPSSGNLIPKGDFAGYKDSVDQDGPEKVQRDFTPGGDSGSDKHAAKDKKTDGPVSRSKWNDVNQWEEGERHSPDEIEDGKKEAARLVADIYTDFARSNGMRVASLDTLDRYASTGIHEADYRLLQALIVRAAEDCEDKDDEDDSDSDDSDSDSDSKAPSASESDDSDDSDDAPDFGGDSASESDDSEDSDSEGGDDYDFGGDTQDSGAAPDAGGQQFTVPEQAPELPPEMMQEIPQDDASGSAPVPPEVIDSLLGLPEGTIEQLLLEEVEQGAQGGDPGMSGPPMPPQGDPGMGGAPQGGGDDFFGGGGDDPEKEPPRVARRRQATDSPSPIPVYGQPLPTTQPQAVNPIPVYGQPRVDPSSAQAGLTVARAFWAAEGDQEQESGGGGGEQAAPAQDPAAAMGGQPMMPPPGSQAVQPPQPPMPLENQPAEDALLDTAGQAIMQMIDRETQEYQQIIGPLSQALQAVQFAQQVEQTENPMDVTPPDGTVNVNPSAAPGGAQNPMQQTAARLQHLTRQAKIQRTLRGAARVIANTYGVSERMLVEAMGRRHYEHVAEAFRILPPQALQAPEVRAAANHIGKMFAAENKMFNTDVWMQSVVGPRTASTGKDRYQDKAYSQSRDRGREEHERRDLADAQAEDEQNHWEQDPEYGRMYNIWQNDPHSFGRSVEDIDRSRRESSRGRLPFDQARLAGVRQAGETWKNTSTMDAFEHPKAGQVPEITDNMTINDLPQPTFKGLPKPKKNTARVAADLGTKVRKWLDKQTEMGLNQGGDPMAEKYLQTHRVGPRGQQEVHEAVGAQPHPFVEEPPNPKNNPSKAMNPVTKKGTLGSRVAKFINDEYGGYHTRDDHDPDHVFTNPRNGEKYMVQHKDGTLFKPGDMITDFRGGQDKFLGISKYPEGNSEGKISVNDRYGPVYYPKNYDAEIVPHTGDWDPDDTQDPMDPRLIGAGRRDATWGEWEPTRQASFFTRKVPGWRWDDHLNGYISKEGKAFSCDCGQKVAAPSYKSCDCGKIWNVYAIGDTHHLASDSADMFIAREIPVRPGVIMANKKMAGEFSDPRCSKCRGDADLQIFHQCGTPNYRKPPYNSPDSNFACSDCWGEHQRQIDETLEMLGGTNPISHCSGCGKDGVSRDHVYAVPLSDAANVSGLGWNPDEDQDPFDPRLIGASRRASDVVRQYLADWTKYDSPDPINEMGKSKPPSTNVTKPPKDWATRLPKGDPSKKGGTWTPPTIPRKKK